jgi:hypothetical protein
MKVELWKWVSGFENEYEISSLGRLRSYKGKNSRILKGGRTKYGYRVHILSKGRKGDYLSTYIHTLVAYAFIGPRPTGQEIRHLDGCGDNSALDNLAYGTPVQNAQDKFAHGTNTSAIRTTCLHGHPWTTGSFYIRPQGRLCKQCHAVRQVRYRASLTA